MNVGFFCKWSNVTWPSVRAVWLCQQVFAAFSRVCIGVKKARPWMHHKLFPLHSSIPHVLNQLRLLPHSDSHSTKSILLYLTTLCFIYVFILYCTFCMWIIIAHFISPGSHPNCLCPSYSVIIVSVQIIILYSQRSENNFASMPTHALNCKHNEMIWGGA